MKVWEATRLEEIKQNGKTKPLLVECQRTASVDDDNDEPRQALFIIKSLGHPEVTEHALFCELFGNQLARSFGISTPPPALVRMGKEFVELARPKTSSHGIKLQPGIAAACRYVYPPIRSITPGGSLSDEELVQATALYGFDL